MRLVVPADVDTPTGGNAYDLALADALRADGDEVEVLRCAAGELGGVLHRPWRGPTLVDGLLACPQPQAVAGARAAVLVHMPLALETRLSRERAAQLDRLERQALQAAALVVATSHWSARYVEDHHRLPRVAVAQPGVDQAPVSAGSEPPLLVHLASLLPHKDQLGVVTALTRLTDLPWRARLAGPVHRDPAYAADVRAAVAAAGLGDRINMPGTMSRNAAWAGADLALLPSLVESFGMVVTEALARGVPAIVSEGGAAEALGVTAAGERPGAVVPAGNPDALADALRRWLTDRPHRDALRRAALARRTTLEPWGVTARRVRDALTRG
ncbi:MAG TPA: glycosyltransferase [Nocardioidaceae bacterium]|nr:glycosyltransferase [Nocardioidaceae bacterium]